MVNVKNEKAIKLMILNGIFRGKRIFERDS
jgi:hypothetical protein